MIDLVAIARLSVDPGVLAMLARVGSGIADDARVAAPKDTGEGAESIDYEVSVDATGSHVRISWDRDHFYMLFHEVGTSEMSPRPFLRPALTKRRTI